MNCPACNSSITQEYYFCPNCGKKLKDKLPQFTILRQIWIYAICIFVPPSGLWYGFQYLRSHDQTAKKIGTIAIVLTIISSVITIWLTILAINSLTQTLNNQLNSSAVGF